MPAVIPGDPIAPSKQQQPRAYPVAASRAGRFHPSWSPHPLFMFARTATVVYKMARSAARQSAGWGARSRPRLFGGYVALQQRVEEL